MLQYVGNKCDLDQKVKREDVEKLAERYGDLVYFEVSCKTGTGVAEMWQKAVAEMQNNWGN